jgi:8-oxo-dGTP pyrophosphatase MutT (NUDIX family)
MNDPRFHRYVATLRSRLAAPLPGLATQLTMAPEYREPVLFADALRRPCREAAVLTPLCAVGGIPSVILTVRPDHLKDHAGQISFPGGRRESGESLIHTALREAQEEVGVAPDTVDVLGALTPLYIPPSNFCVYPFVGVVADDVVLIPNETEVMSILQIPLPDLLRSSAQRRERLQVNGQTVTVPCFSVDGHRIWGATAMILAELLAACTNDYPDPGHMSD